MLFIGGILTVMVSRGFDYVIICCSDESAENYWQEREGL